MFICMALLTGEVHRMTYLSESRSFCGIRALVWRSKGLKNCLLAPNSPSSASASWSLGRKGARVGQCKWVESANSCALQMGTNPQAIEVVIVFCASFTANIKWRAVQSFKQSWFSCYWANYELFPFRSQCWTKEKRQESILTIWKCQAKSWILNFSFLDISMMALIWGKKWRTIFTVL